MRSRLNETQHGSKQPAACTMHMHTQSRDGRLFRVRSTHARAGVVLLGRRRRVGHAPLRRNDLIFVVVMATAIQ